MKIKNNLVSVVTACGNVLRGSVEVNGRDFTIESDGEKWVNIIDDKSSVEACVIDGKDVVVESGEFVTEDWTEQDWKQLSSFVCN